MSFFFCTLCFLACSDDLVLHVGGQWRNRLVLFPVPFPFPLSFPFPFSLSLSLSLGFLSSLALNDWVLMLVWLLPTAYCLLPLMNSKELWTWMMGVEGEGGCSVALLGMAKGGGSLMLIWQWENCQC